MKIDNMDNKLKASILSLILIFLIENICNIHLNTYYYLEFPINYFFNGIISLIHQSNVLNNTINNLKNTMKMFIFLLSFAFYVLLFAGIFKAIIYWIYPEQE